MHWVGACTSKNAVAVSHSTEVYIRYTFGTYRLIEFNMDTQQDFKTGDVSAHCVTTICLLETSN